MRPSFNLNNDPGGTELQDSSSIRSQHHRRLPVGPQITQSVCRPPSDTSRQPSAAQLPLQRGTVTAGWRLQMTLKTAVRKPWSGAESQVHCGRLNCTPASSRAGCRGGESQTGEAAELKRLSGGAGATAGRRRRWTSAAVRPGVASGRRCR